MFEKQFFKRRFNDAAHETRTTKRARETYNKIRYGAEWKSDIYRHSIVYRYTIYRN